MAESGVVMGPAGRDRVMNQADRREVVRDSDDLRRGSPESNMLRPVGDRSRTPQRGRCLPMWPATSLTMRHEWCVEQRKGRIAGTFIKHIRHDSTKVNREWQG